MPTDWRKTSVAGHFGELLQGKLAKDGPVVLVTLPCPTLGVRIMYTPARDFRLYAPQKLLSRTAVAKIFKLLGQPARGHIILQSDMPPGGGAGASTAAILGLLRLLTPIELLPEQEAQLCLKIEGASDPLMHKHCDKLLWASRYGVPLRKIPAAPDFEIIGGFGALGERTNSADDNFAQIDDLIEPWCKACRSNNRKTAGEIASTSAARNVKKRGSLPIDDLLQLARDLGAHGIVAAHTGSARGLLFTPGKVPIEARSALLEQNYRNITQFRNRGPQQ